MKHPYLLSRRQLLETAASLAGWTLTAGLGSVFSQEPNQRYTPQVTSGPFYPLLKPLDQDADLTVISGKQGRAQGRVLHLAGQVLNEKGEPVEGARVEIWQANARGRYSHASDPNPEPLDPNFEGYGVQNTDADGRYRFKTIKPGAYPGIFAGMRAPHIHFQVTGKVDRIVTQMLFPNEPLNETDNILQSYKGWRKEALIGKLAPPTKDLEANSLIALWNIVLIKG